ncbi:hypothetical protein B7P43_G08456 [Cryptotermes secundus]|uniref:Uncharacterized protein n=1 Tax=Cryptotermes secundus TaxID=105785 RepID=A0A2J7PZQ7_9NEOP|nr:hypothetical protein B7P43_G08456 [Cryptotermes secundus]
MFCTAAPCYAELFERFLSFPGWFQLLLQFLPQDHVASTGVSYTRLCMYPQRKKSVESSQRSKGAFMSNPSIAKGSIQILMVHISAVCWGAIMLDPHFTIDFQRHHFQQLR